MYSSALNIICDDIVRIITDKRKFLTGEYIAQVHAEEVAFDNTSVQTGEIHPEILYRLGVYFGHPDLVPVFHQELRQNAHTRPHFQHIGRRRVGERSGNIRRNGQIRQEMLPQVFFRFYFQSFIEQIVICPFYATK